MGLRVRDFRSIPEFLPPSGGSVVFRFKAQSSGTPSHLRATISIPADEPYIFSPAAGGDSRQIFVPAEGRLPAPTSPTELGSGPTLVAPLGRHDPARTLPLKINLLLQGFDGSGTAVGRPRPASLLISMNTMAMILELAHSSLGLTQGEMGEALGVHANTVGRVMRGADSPKLRANLESMLRGGGP